MEEEFITHKTIDRTRAAELIDLATFSAYWTLLGAVPSYRYSNTVDALYLDPNDIQLVFREIPNHIDEACLILRGEEDGDNPLLKPRMNDILTNSNQEELIKLATELEEYHKSGYLMRDYRDCLILRSEWRIRSSIGDCAWDIISSIREHCSKELRELGDHVDWKDSILDILAPEIISFSEFDVLLNPEPRSIEENLELIIKLMSEYLNHVRELIHLIVIDRGMLHNTINHYIDRVRHMHRMRNVLITM